MGSDLIERLRAFSNRESEMSRSMAEAKSLRQADNFTGECVYAWSKPEDTLTGQAADEITALRARVAALEAGLVPFAVLADEIERVSHQHGWLPEEIRRSAKWEYCSAARALLANRGGANG